MITFVNVFTVHLGQQSMAFEHIEKIYNEVVKVQDGFIDATLLKGEDGTKVTAVVHWDNTDRIGELWNIPRFQELHDKDYEAAIAKVEPSIYSTAVLITADS